MDILFIFDQTKGNVVNRALSALHGGSLEITLAVLLRDRFWLFFSPVNKNIDGFD